MGIHKNLIKMSFQEASASITDSKKVSSIRGSIAIETNTSLD